jgi:signal transduction histidine kinase
MSFTDTGSGISPQQTEKIFEPFQSNFEGGTGLGLAIVYQIVQAHEGNVWARSKPNQGTSFVVRLRRYEEGIAPASPSSSGTPDSQAAAAAAGGTRG